MMWLRGLPERLRYQRGARIRSAPPTLKFCQPDESSWLPAEKRNFWGYPKTLGCESTLSHMISTSSVKISFAIAIARKREQGQDGVRGDQKGMGGARREASKGGTQTCRRDL